MYTYISITAEGNYVELDEQLNPAINEIGETWEDYLNNKWILLNEEQLEFKSSNPEASVKEVFFMFVKPKPVIDVLQEAKKKKLNEIEEQDIASNKFFVSVISNGEEVVNQELWIGKDIRTSLLNTTLPALISDGKSTTKLWTETIPRQSIEVPIDWAMKNIPLIEIYAKRTYDLRASNEASVYDATTVEEVEKIDARANYPYILTFELNIDIQNGINITNKNKQS